MKQVLFSLVDIMTVIYLVDVIELKFVFKKAWLIYPEMQLFYRHNMARSYLKRRTFSKIVEHDCEYTEK